MAIEPLQPAELPKMVDGLRRVDPLEASVFWSKEFQFDSVWIIPEKFYFDLCLSLCRYSIYVVIFDR